MRGRCFLSALLESAMCVSVSACLLASLPEVFVFFCWVEVEFWTYVSFLFLFFSSRTVLLCICVKMSDGINVTDLASV